MRRAVWALGLLALLGVLGTGATALVVAPDRQWLRAHGVRVALPREHWTLAPATQAIRYDERALVRAPAVYDADFCPSAASSSRAFLGLLPPVAGPVADAVAGAATAWGRAVQGVSGATGAAGAAGAAERPGGSRADLDVPVPPGPCSPTTAHLTVVGRATPRGVVVLVLVRDVGEPGDLTSAEADRIVGSMVVSR
jgi:hypothetical protein